MMHRILITNDDGIMADGLIRLAAAAKNFGDVLVIAPDSQRSAASHAITLHGEIDIFPHDFPVPGVTAFSCSGTPADCVRIGCVHLCSEKPDTVLSGINFGYNVATDVQYSGTAGAAFEGAFQGCRAAAFSEAANGCHAVTDAYLHTLLAEVLETELSYGEIININFPGCALEALKGIRKNHTVSHGMFYRDRYLQTAALPGGGMRLKVDGVYNEDTEPGTDFEAVVRNYISVGTVCNVGGAEVRDAD